MKRHEESRDPEQAGLFGEASGGETDAGSYGARDGDREGSRREGSRREGRTAPKDAGQDREIPRGTDEHAD